MQTKKIVLTPDVFFDLFVLCLSWQWDPKSLTFAWTTVDKVVRILHGLDIVSDKQRRVLYRDKRTQGLFRMRSLFMFGRSPEGCSGEKREGVLNSRFRLVISVPMASDVNRERMLRDYHIYLTRRGKLYAGSIEAKYRDFITSERYFAEIERQGTFLDRSEAALVMENYRARVNRETDEGAVRS